MTARKSKAPLVPVGGPNDPLPTFKLIGAGGVGGIVARYLVVYLAALRRPARFVLIDGDDFEPRNAARMLFSRAGNKATVVREDLLDAMGDADALGQLEFTAVEEYVTPDNLPRLIRPGDVVLLAVDNHATRKLVDDHCATLPDITLISGGNDGVGPDSSGRDLRGTYGNVQVHRRVAREVVARPLSALHPEIADPADKLPTDVACTDALESVPQLLFTNLQTASAILNTTLLALADALAYDELCFDVADALMRPAVPRKKAGATVPHGSST